MNVEVGICLPSGQVYTKKELEELYHLILERLENESEFESEFERRAWAERVHRWNERRAAWRRMSATVGERMAGG